MPNDPIGLLTGNAALQVLASCLLGAFMPIPIQPWASGLKARFNVKALLSAHIDWLLLAFMQLVIAGLHAVGRGDGIGRIPRDAVENVALTRAQPESGIEENLTSALVRLARNRRPRRADSESTACGPSAWPDYDFHGSRSPTNCGFERALEPDEQRGDRSLALGVAWCAIGWRVVM